MRTVSLTMRHAMNAEHTGEVVIALFTLTHPSVVDPLYISSDPTKRFTTTPLVYGTTSRANDYLFVPITLALPDDVDERAPTSRIILSNVSREIIQVARTFSTPPKCLMELVLSSNPDVVEVAYPEFDIKNMQYTAQQITLELSIESLTDEPYPAGSFTPAGFGGLF